MHLATCLISEFLLSVHHRPASSTADLSSLFGPEAQDSKASIGILEQPTPAWIPDIVSSDGTTGLPPETILSDTTEMPPTWAQEADILVCDITDLPPDGPLETCGPNITVFVTDSSKFSSTWASETLCNNILEQPQTWPPDVDPGLLPTTVQGSRSTISGLSASTTYNSCIQTPVMASDIAEPPSAVSSSLVFTRRTVGNPVLLSRKGTTIPARYLTGMRQLLAAGQESSSNSSSSVSVVWTGGLSSRPLTQTGQSIIGVGVGGTNAQANITPRYGTPNHMMIFWCFSKIH